MQGFFIVSILIFTKTSARAKNCAEHKGERKWKVGL